MSGLMSLNEAAAVGIERLRQPTWSDLRDYVLIDIEDGKPGPLFRLYSPFNAAAGLPNPCLLSWEDVKIGVDERCFLPSYPDEEIV